MLPSMSKNEAMSTDYTNIIKTLGARSEITIDTSSLDDGVRTSYHLIKRSTPNTFGVLAVNELPAAGPALTLPPKIMKEKYAMRLEVDFFANRLMLILQTSHLGF